MCHLVHRMVLISPVCTHRGIPYLEFHFLHFLELLIHNRMQYQLVELCMGPLEGYRRSLNLAIEVLGLVVAVPLALSAVTSHISRTANKLWVVLDLLLTSLPLKTLTASPLLGVHYLKLGWWHRFTFLFLLLLPPSQSTDIQMPSELTFIFRYRLKGLAKHFVMDSLLVACLRYWTSGNRHTISFTHLVCCSV